MTRFGWWMLLAFLVVIGGFALIVREGRVTERTATPAAPGPTTAMVIPVAGVRADQLQDTWGDPRGDGSRGHHAIDIMAPRGTPVLAASPGTIEKLFESGAGGHTVYVRVDPATVHYYAHLDSYAPDLREGIAVAQGQTLGAVGSTGDASAEAPHLHFEVKRMGAGEKWWRGQEVDPYPLLAGRAAHG